MRIKISNEINTEKEYEIYCAILDRLMDIEVPSIIEQRFMSHIAVLIEEYEERQYGII